MNWRKLALIVLVVLLVLALAIPAAADKKKKKKHHGQDDESGEPADPMAGRFGFGFSFGGVTSSAGTGFQGGVSLTYYFNSYFSTTLGTGYGLYPVEYEGPDGGSETTQVNFIPTTLALTLHPMPGSRISPYFGPGVGATYTWYQQKVEQDNGDIEEEKFDETLWSAFLQAGITFALGGGFSANIGLTYTLPDLSDIDFADAYFSYSGGGGFMF